MGPNSQIQLLSNSSNMQGKRASKENNNGPSMAHNMHGTGGLGESMKFNTGKNLANSTTGLPHKSASLKQTMNRNQSYNGTATAGSLGRTTTTVEKPSVMRDGPSCS
jgi:hypothetical protein